MIGIATFALALSLTGEARVTTGRFEGRLFQFAAWRCSGSFQSQWRSHTGQMIAEETLTLTEGQWTQYRLRQSLADSEALATNDGGLIRVTIHNGSGSRKIAIPSDGQTLAGPLLIEFLGLRIKAIRDRVPVEFAYLVAERGLVLKLRAVLEGGAGDGTTAVRVEAASFVLRPFIPKILLVYNAEGLLLSTEGRLLPLLGDEANPSPVEGVLRLKPTRDSCEGDNAVNGTTSIDSGVPYRGAAILFSDLR